MTTKELQMLFDKFDDEYIKFERVENKRSQRPDLHAFLLIDSLVPGTRDIVGSAEHDEFYLSVSAEELAESAITESQVEELVRCGVRYDSHYDSFAMFT